MTPTEKWYTFSNWYKCKEIIKFKSSRPEVFCKIWLYNFTIKGVSLKNFLKAVILLISLWTANSSNSEAYSETETERLKAVNYFCKKVSKEDHWVKSARIQSFSGPYFPAFGLNKYLSVFSQNAGKCGPEYLRIWTLFMQWMFVRALNMPFLMALKLRRYFLKESHFIAIWSC